MADTTQSSPRKRILLIEDEKPLSHALKLKLSHEGYDVTVAEDGEAGLNAATAQFFDLILIDIIMPKMDGFAVLAKLKEKGATQKIVVLSNLGQQEDIEKAKDSVQKEVEEVLIETGMEGIVIKADNIGSLEAMIKILKEKNVMIRNASIGHITKKDIADAESNFEKDPLNSAILGFNSKLPEDLLVPKKVKIILNDVIYRLVEDYEKWKADAAKNIEALKLETLTKPCKIQLLSGYVFRQNNPAVVGVEVLGGKLLTGMTLMNSDGKELTDVNGIQLDKKSISEADKGKKVAISLPKVTVGRQINENDVLYSAIPEEDFRKMKELKKYLSFDEIQIIKEIALIKRKENALWGV